MAAFQKTSLYNELLKVFIVAILTNKMPFYTIRGLSPHTYLLTRAGPPMEEMIAIIAVGIFGETRLFLSQSCNLISKHCCASLSIKAHCFWAVAQLSKKSKIFVFNFVLPSVPFVTSFYHLFPPFSRKKSCELLFESAVFLFFQLFDD